MFQKNVASVLNHQFADSLKNEKKKKYRNIGYMFFFLFFLSKKNHLIKKIKVCGYIVSFPVVLIMQLYHKMALAKNLHEQKKTLCQLKFNET